MRFIRRPPKFIPLDFRPAKWGKKEDYMIVARAATRSDTDNTLAATQAATMLTPN
jgi:hypothetical protein